jgi:hypothetical protein
MSSAPGPDNAEANAQIILRVAKAIGALLDLSDVLAALVETLKPMVHFDAVSIGILERNEVRLYSTYIEGLPRKAGEPLDGLVARQASALYAPDIKVGPCQ